MKFNPLRSINHYGTAETIFQANMPCYLWSPPRAKFIGLLLYSNHCTVLAFSSSNFPLFPSLPKLPSRFTLFHEKQMHQYIQIFQFVLSKSCFSCNPLNFMMQDHSPNHSSHPVFCKKPFLCNFYTLELPGGHFKIPLPRLHSIQSKSEQLGMGANHQNFHCAAKLEWSISSV